eukprot:GHVT01013100.1.p1 GENE.GHVT01013100.1~~GHVT01013100.1.p1  ORF type:complete len:464 (+),score=42.30 GHVT01013100.1:1051-2442(+)
MGTWSQAIEDAQEAANRSGTDFASDMMRVASMCVRVVAHRASGESEVALGFALRAMAALKKFGYSECGVSSSGLCPCLAAEAHAAGQAIAMPEILTGQAATFNRKEPWQSLVAPVVFPAVATTGAESKRLFPATQICECSACLPFHKPQKPHAKLLACLHLELALLFYATKKPERAQEEFAAALEFVPNLSSANFHRGRLKLDQGQYADAVVDFRAALRYCNRQLDRVPSTKINCSPSNRAQNVKIRSHAKQGSKNEAPPISCWEIWSGTTVVLDEASKSAEPEVLYFLGVSYANLGAHQKALRCFEQSMEKTDGVLVAFPTLCPVGRRTRTLTPKISEAQTLQRVAAGEAEAGGSVKGSGLRGVEWEVRTQAHGLEPYVEISCPSFLVHERAKSLQALGHHELAIREFRRAISLEPHNVRAKFRLAFSLKYIGDFDTAAEVRLTSIVLSWPSLHSPLSCSRK